MLVSNSFTRDDNLLRRYYVGLTRAKNRLFIHTNTDYFEKLGADKYTIDQHQYPMPEEIVIQLSHRDVNLSFFKNRKKDVLSLRDGDALDFKDTVFYETEIGKSVAKLSSRMETTLSEWYQKGYQVKSATVRFIVAWRPKERPKDEPETAVLLPEMVLVRFPNKP